MVSCSFSAEPPTCSWAKLRIFSTKAVSLEGRKGWLGRGDPTGNTWRGWTSPAPSQKPRPCARPYHVLLFRCSQAP